jgi:thioesterase domain-containing protein
MLDASVALPPSVVVPLQVEGTMDRPLFLIHAGGGYVFFYRALASRLAPEVRVYAVRAETAGDGEAPFFRSRTLEEVAARYTERILAVQPHGPYALGGASFGGAVAFEIARRLRERNEEVAPVLLFATLVRPADGGPLPSVGVAPLPRRIAAHLGHAAELTAVDAVRYVSRKLLDNAKSEAVAAVRDVRRGVRSISSDIAREITHARLKVLRQAIPPELMYRCSLNLKTGNRLLAEYVPRPCDVRIVIFRAAMDHDPEVCWRGLALRGLETHDFPGGHLDLLEEPSVADTAAVVRRALA